MAVLPTWQVRFSRWRAGDAPEVLEFRCDALVVGRKDCDVTLRGPSVSRHHCELSVDGRGRLQVLDRGSTNGTWVNGDRLGAARPRVVRVGDELRIGDWRLSLEAPPERVEAVMARSEQLEAMRDRASGLRD